MWVWTERGRGRAPGPADEARLTPRQSQVWVHRACFLGLLTLADWTEALPAPSHTVQHVGLFTETFSILRDGGSTDPLCDSLPHLSTLRPGTPQRIV